MSESLEYGHVEYTGRAFLQDAQEAMGDNIVRGIVELITNADDAYTKTSSKQGRIKVEVEHRRGREWWVIVRDRATGMTRDELKQKMMRLGGRTSGFETGLAVRGNRGRGAKDLVAFGPVEFETICSDKYAYMKIEQNGDVAVSPRARTATPEDRQRLGIPRGNGTVVAVAVSPSHSCPRHDTLAEQLQNHFQLRDIMSARDREVILVNLTRDEQRRLSYGLSLPSLENKVDRRVSIEGYPEAEARLQIWQLPERCDQPKSEPARPCGILVRGRRAIYENTLFALENNPYASWFAGYLDCPYIDQLANAYDDAAERASSQSRENPIPLITRRREGLASDHPFTKALANAVSPVLESLAREREESERSEAGRVETEQTRRSLDRMAREAARFLLEAMREIEADEPTTRAEGQVEDLEIVPPEVFFRLGEDRTVSVLARTAGIEPGQSVEIVIEPGGILELLDGSSVPLQPHRRREDVLSGQLHLRPLIEGETLVSASIDGRDALALMTVRPAIEREEPEPEELIEALEFEKPRYRVRWNKNKELSLRAPVELVERFGSSLCVISNDPGIVVTRGGKVSLAIGPGDPVARGTCRVEGRQLGAKARIRAELGDQIAHCYIVVDQRDDGLPRLQIALVNEEPTVYRALFHPSDVQPGEEQTIKVYARHKGLKRYFGDAPEFPGQDTPAARAVVAEVVTEAIVRRIVSRKYPTANEEIDADLVYFEHVSYTSRLLPIMQQMSMGPLQTQ